MLLSQPEAAQHTLLVCTQHCMAMPILLGTSMGSAGLEVLQQVPLCGVDVLFPIGSAVLLLKILMHFVTWKEILALSKRMQVFFIISSSFLVSLLDIDTECLGTV